MKVPELTGFRGIESKVAVLFKADELVAVYKAVHWKRVVVGSGVLGRGEQHGRSRRRARCLWCAEDLVHMD
jgi:hypothetical protein